MILQDETTGKNAQVIACESVVKYSKDGLVCFDPVKHTYYKGEKRLKGVTSFIGEYKEYFDSELQAEKYAKKHGLTKDEVLARWNDNRDEGTRVHKIFENYIETGAISCNSGKEITAVKIIVDLFRSERLTPVACEYLIYGEHLASMIDCICRDKNGRYYILDWKTSKNINKENYGKWMKPPFKKIEDSIFNHYSIQVSIYKQLLKEYDISGMYLVKIGETDYQLIKADFIPIPENLL